MASIIPTGSFTYFPKLPPELRSRIWLFAANHGRTITIRDDGLVRVRRVHHNAKVVPGILHANAESRSIARKHYQEHLGPHFNGKAIYLNYDADTLCFPTLLDFNTFYGIEYGAKALADIVAVCREMEEKLKHLIVSGGTVIRYHNLLTRFWRAEKMVVGTPFNDHPNVFANFERLLNWIEHK